MRCKQRPIKSNRHKSVASFIDCPEISFQKTQRHNAMQMAYLENNDITPETWKDIDFSSLSSLILKHNTNQDFHTTQRQSVVRATDDDAERIQPIDRRRSPKSIAKPEIVSNISGTFLCDEPDCGKTFPSLRKLRHHRVVHSNEFPFVCQSEGCGKRFKRKFGIDLHSTTHFDLDPSMYEKTSNNSSLAIFGRRMQYSMCKPCNKKFKTVHEYQDHMLNHGEEPFKCLVEGCGQTFSIWKSYQKHRASHYFNYYCKVDPQCDHSTSNLQLLKLHIYCCHFRRTLPPSDNNQSSSEINDFGLNDSDIPFFNDDDSRPISDDDFFMDS